MFRDHRFSYPMTRSMKVTKHYTQANQHSGCCRYLQLVFFPYNTDLHFANKHLHQYTYKKKKKSCNCNTTKEQNLHDAGPNTQTSHSTLAFKCSFIHTHAHKHTVH